MGVIACVVVVSDLALLVHPRIPAGRNAIGNSRSGNTDLRGHGATERHNNDTHATLRDLLVYSSSWPPARALGDDKHFPVGWCVA